MTSATVLVVDDDPANLAVLAELLEPDYVVRVAQSGQRALQVVVTEPRPDVILLDIQMPDMSGYEVLEALREEPSTEEIPVVFITARTTTEDEERGLRLGAADFIFKPIQPTIVRARVRTQLENKAARDLLKQRNDWLTEDLLRAQRVGRIGSWTLELNTRKMEFSPEACRLFGLAEGIPLERESFLQAVYPDDRERGEAAWEAALAGRPYDIEYRTANSQGQTWVREVGEAGGWVCGEPTVALGTVQEITEKKRHEQQLEALAFSDPLTGLPNRHAFAQSLEKKLDQIAESRSVVSLHQIDLDGLGQINTSMGNQAGDEVLRIIGQRLTEFVGTTGEVAHLGGDKFAVAMYGHFSEECTAKQVKQLQALIEQPIRVASDSISTTACIGSVQSADYVVRRPGPLLRMAGQAMYQAKLGGRCRHVQFDLSQYQSDRSLQDRIDKIRLALRETQFRLYYQPKVDLLNGGLIGLEALIRWQHPERGLLGPGEVIPFLEGHPLMVELGDWVIDAALAQLLEWQNAGLTTTVSVNVATNQLQHPEFIDKLAARLANYPSLEASQIAIDPALFELEILESGPMLDLSRSVQLFKRLREIGVSISLDDFGTGHSSLQTLNALGPNILKIDQSFVLGMLSDSKNLAIVRAILDLGRSFGLKVVAEGLETPAHGQTLIELGCRYAQGYGIARPMPARQVTDWLAQWHDQMPEWIGAHSRSD